ncbi:hypothetical protein EO244_16510 [Ancylomarina salipaludis]|uniref:Uncharacterized protein n=1 Tax=Ancylomarina salipaludis TaxID=2501299 RepID=A0A4Q1JHK2_9BACT|nr:hypothetical protein [Ancylomarina salipaludis]RXQ87280.1 hypothetical protein EO244_16510 [Ancylomarina salipaludis]
MKKILTIVFVFITIIAKGQEEFSAFSYLYELKVANSFSIFFDKTNARIINKQRKDIPKGEPFYCEYPEDLDGETIVLVELFFNDNYNTKYTILYSEGSSSDPEFSIYLEESHIGDIKAVDLAITKSGNFYASGHANTNFNERRKYQLKNDELIEIKQPFLYVGLKSKTLEGITLFETKDLKNKVATLPIGYDVEVILADQYIEDLYLIKTKFGLIGWAQIESGQYISKVIEGIRYMGD